MITSHPTQGARDAFVLSRKGRETLDRGLRWVRAVARLDVALVPALEFKARPQYLRGDFATAAFVAMKEVEVRVLARAQLGTDDIGVKLMTKAFRPGGPLYRADREGGESAALMNLFQGAIGLFKNPSSHREVDLDDPTEAAEIVLLADLLPRLLDKTDNPTAGSPSVDSVGFGS